jgi:hypothetical protein
VVSINGPIVVLVDSFGPDVLAQTITILAIFAMPRYILSNNHFIKFFQLYFLGLRWTILHDLLILGEVRIGNSQHFNELTIVYYLGSALLVVKP